MLRRKKWLIYLEVFLLVALSLKLTPLDQSFTATKILPMDSSFISLAMEVERIAAYSFSNQEVVSQFETIACSLVSWLVSKGYYGE